MRFLATLVLLLAAGLTQAGSPTWAVLRVPSHGCTATIIHTQPGLTYLLMCGHAFEPIVDKWGHVIEDMEHKRMVFNIPANGDWAQWSAASPSQRLVAFNLPSGKVDPRTGKPIPLDLALIEIGFGPTPYCCPVAGATYVPGKRIVSVGYDEMILPYKVCTATLWGHQAWIPTPRGMGLLDEPHIEFTKEPPWHGRSGGPLIDLDAWRLIGVCTGYVGNPKAAKAGDPMGGPGMYTAHNAIRSFLSRCGWQSH